MLNYYLGWPNKFKFTLVHWSTKVGTYLAGCVQQRVWRHCNLPRRLQRHIPILRANAYMPVTKKVQIRYLRYTKWHQNPVIFSVDTEINWTVLNYYLGWSNKFKFTLVHWSTKVGTYLAGCVQQRVWRHCNLPRRLQRHIPILRANAYMPVTKKVQIRYLRYTKWHQNPVIFSVDAEINCWASYRVARERNRVSKQTAPMISERIRLLSVHRSVRQRSIAVLLIPK